MFQLSYRMTSQRSLLVRRLGPKSVWILKCRSRARCLTSSLLLLVTSKAPCYWPHECQNVFSWYYSVTAEASALNFLALSENGAQFACARMAWTPGGVAQLQMEQAGRKELRVLQVSRWASLYVPCVVPTKATRMQALFGKLWFGMSMGLRVPFCLKSWDTTCKMFKGLLSRSRLSYLLPRPPVSSPRPTDIRWYRLSKGSFN